MNYSELGLDTIRSGDTVRFPLGSDPGAPWALLSLRPLGSMRFIPDSPNPLREGFFRDNGIEPARVLAVELVHSRTVLFPSGPDELRGVRADGIIVKPGPWVPTVTVADCMPIWIRHERSGACGILHSGWQGTGILEDAVRGLGDRFGALPSEIDAVLGPAIGPCCYRVPEERAEYFRSKFGPESACFEDGSWKLDLGAANLGIARALGLRSVTRMIGCTSCHPDFGSFRREGPDRFTRMVAAAVWGLSGRDAA